MESGVTERSGSLPSGESFKAIGLFEMRRGELLFGENSVCAGGLRLLHVLPGEPVYPQLDRLFEEIESDYVTLGDLLGGLGGSFTD